MPTSAGQEIIQAMTELWRSNFRIQRGREPDDHDLAEYRYHTFGIGEKPAITVESFLAGLGK